MTDPLSENSEPLLGPLAADWLRETLHKEHVLAIADVLEDWAREDFHALPTDVAERIIAALRLDREYRI